MIAQVLVGVAVGYWFGRSNSNNENRCMSKNRNDSDENSRGEPPRRICYSFRIPFDFGLFGFALSVLSEYIKTWNWRAMTRLSVNELQQQQQQDSIRFVEAEECRMGKAGSSNDSNSDDDETTSCATTTSTTSVPILETTITATINTTAVSGSDEDVNTREDTLRTELKRTDDEISRRQSTVPVKQLPKHVAVIMDGNRRYGLEKYNDKSRGHWDGSSKLIEFAKWCLAEQIPILTVYAFSTENWNRSKSEIDTLMEIFITHCDELRIESQKRGIRVLVLSTDTSKIPPSVKAGLDRLVNETRSCKGNLTMNICLSYGSRGEIVQACKSLAHDAMQGKINPMKITEHDVEQRLLTTTKMLQSDAEASLISTKSQTIVANDPDVLIRTSGEVRMSNFLLWQMAYTELFFLSKTWPEISKDDLLNVIEEYATGRKRRFGQ